MKNTLILFCIITAGFFLRFYLLGEVPVGLTSDEANTGYDAYSVLTTGKDQWGQFFPVTSFKGFGDFRSPLYTYLVIPFVSIFGLWGLAVKFPSAIAGVLSIFLIYKISKKLFNKSVGFSSSFLLAVSPWGIGLSRQGVESNVGIAIYLTAFWFYLLSKEHKKLLSLSLLLFVLTLFTYTSYLIFTPLTVFTLFVIDRKYILKNRSLYIASSIVFVIGILPFMLSNNTGAKRFSQVGIIGDVSSVGLLTTLNQKIGSCNEVLPSFFCRSINNKAQLYSSVFFQNYIHHFSFDFLYVKGTTTQYSMLPERGLLYLYEAVFLIFGLLVIFTKQRKSLIIVMLLLFAAVPDSLSGGGHHSRSSSMLPFLTIIEGVGVVFLINKIKQTKYKHAILLTVSGFILFSVVAFCITYFTFFNKNYSPYSNSAYESVSIDWAKEERSQIYVSKYLNDSPHYIYYLFFNKLHPDQFRKFEKVVKTEPNGFMNVSKLNNLWFVNTRFDQLTASDIGKYPKNAIFYAHPDAFPENITYIDKFTDESGGAIFLKVSYNELVRALSK